MRRFPVNRSRSVGVLLALLAVAPPSAAQTPSPLRVLTHNVYLIPGAPSREERARLLAEAEYLRGYDVLVLAELFDEEAAAPLLSSLAADYPYRTPILGAFDGHDPDCRGADPGCWNDTAVRGEDRKRLAVPLSRVLLNGGVAVLSRWPIVEKVQGVFTARCGEDALANKGFVYVRLDRDGESVHVVGVHTQASPEWDELVAAVAQSAAAPLARFLGVPPCGGGDVAAAVRLAQLAQLRRYLDARDLPAGEPVVIAGDMNVDRGRAGEYRALLAVLGAEEPVYDAASHGSTWDPASNELATGDGAWLDYVLLLAGHGGLRPWIERSFLVCPDGAGHVREYSDHYPVAAATSAQALPAGDARCAEVAPFRPGFREPR